MSFVEQSKKVPRVLLLHVLNKSLKIPKKLMKPSEAIEDIFFYPKIKNESDLSDILNRIAWYLPNCSNETIKIWTDLEKKDIDLVELKKNLPSNYSSYLTRNVLEKVSFVSENHIAKLNRSSRILIWDKKSLFDFNGLKNLNKILMVDPTFYSHTESSTYREIDYKSLSFEKKTHLLDLYKSRYKEIENLTKKYKRATVFGSGPSLENAFNHDFSESFTIVCNSIVKNKELLEQIKPNIIVFADPVLHFGVSLYSEEFRKHLVEAVRKYGSYCIVPEQSANLIASNLPSISQYIIGMPTNSPYVKFPSVSDFAVKSSSNILTLLMLPIASSLFNEVHIIGSDGRQKNEKNFWKHSNASQFNNLMDSVYQSHPSFFRDRLYADYYNRHVKYLEEIINAGEQKGKSYYSLEASYMEVLQKRKIRNE